MSEQPEQVGVGIPIVYALYQTIKSVLPLFDDWRLTQRRRTVSRSTCESFSGLRTA
jgi:hypothetical protein